MASIRQRIATMREIWHGKPPELAEAQVEAENIAYSVDILLEEMRRTLTRQEAHASTIDTKASFYLTSASIIVGFGGLRAGTADNPVLGLDWMAAGLLLYLFLFISVVQAYRLHHFTSAGLNPDTLPVYLFEDPEYTKRQLIAVMREIHRVNGVPIGQKVWWLRRAELLFGLLVGYLVFVFLGHSQADHIRPAWDSLTDWVRSYV